jgi:NAD(P)-dependent dehydrogenase (short-subunit alcohol dehydrogenase family)
MPYHPMPYQQSHALTGRAALVTGANRGLGLEIAQAFVAAGGSVMLCARDTEPLEAARRQMAALVGKGQSVVWRTCDVTDSIQVSSVVEQSIQEFGDLQILVNNAGVYGPFGPIENVDLTEWARAVEINLLGSVLPTRAVLPHFKASGYGKIIQISGGGATNPLPGISAYAASKAAVVRFAETIAEECKEFKIDVNSIAPGLLNTRLLEEVLAAGPEKVGKQFHSRMVRQKEQGGSSMVPAVELAVFLGSGASDGITGKLISALWDDWQTWPAHIEELQNGDVYTLRRITGHDRGLDWGDK